jgi:hypothetical protein
MRDERRSSLALGVFTAVFAVSLALNVYQGWTIRQFRADQPKPRIAALPVGSPFPPLRVTDLNGGAYTVTYQDARPTVLYVLSPKCGWCARNERNINALANAKAKDYRFIGLSLVTAGLQQYIASRDLPFPVYTNISRNVATALDLTGTPQLLVVSRQGKLMKGWRGAFDGDVQVDIERYFDVRLPGLAPAPSERRRASD